LLENTLPTVAGYGPVGVTEIGAGTDETSIGVTIGESVFEMPVSIGVSEGSDVSTGASGKLPLSILLVSMLLVSIVSCPKP
jgi:hypothetical protein